MSAAQPANAAALFEAWSRSLFGTALRFLRRTEEAEDVLQEAFLAYHRQNLQLPLDEGCAWLRRVVINRSLDRLRAGRRWRLEEVAEDHLGSASGGAGGYGAARVDLERAVATLSDVARQVFLLHDVEGYEHREIAQILGIPEGTSKSYLSRARAALRRILRPAEAAS
jgi:RNA polymerase sigma-70 factor (ECF subfamily)